MKRCFLSFFIVVIVVAGPVFASGDRLNQENSEIQEQVKILQKVMMNDAEIMSVILSLQNDPEFQKALEDPSLLKAVNSGDIDVLISNQIFMNLLNDFRIQDIKEKVME